MYAKAKIGGFLHLCIGEEATVVGATQALRDNDYLMSTYREHGQAIARGTPPNAVMAELFGRVDGCSKGRGGSMHLFDMEKRFLGGYGIVGGSLPLSAGVALACDYMETEDAILSMMGDGATNQGTFGETMNLAALWKLPVVFVIINNQFGMGTALHRHSAVTDLSLKSEGYGVPGTRCDGMDVLDVHDVVTDALRCAREERKPQLVEAVTYRFRGHSMADPEEYRSKDEVEEWRERDPIQAFGKRLVDEGVITQDQFEELDEKAIKTVDEAHAVRRPVALPGPRLPLRRRVRLHGRRSRLVDRRRALPRGAPRRARARGRRAAAPARGGRRRLRERGRPGGAQPPPGDSTDDEDESTEDETARARSPETSPRPREAPTSAGDALPRGAQPGAPRGDAGGREGLPDGRGHRRVPGSLQGDRRPARGVRREARARHADLGEHDRRHGRGLGDARPAPGGRADDDQLLAARDGPDREPRGGDPLHVRRPGEGADGGAHAAGRGAPARARRTRTASRPTTCTCPACWWPRRARPRTPRAC